jgi:hypothetical protein
VAAARLVVVLAKIDVLAPGLDLEAELGGLGSEGLDDTGLQLVDGRRGRDAVIDNGGDDLGLTKSVAVNSHTLTRALTLTPPLIMSTAWVVEIIDVPMPGGRTKSLAVPFSHHSWTFASARSSTLPFSNDFVTLLMAFLRYSGALGAWLAAHDVYPIRGDSGSRFAL